MLTLVGQTDNHSDNFYAFKWEKLQHVNGQFELQNKPVAVGTNEHSSECSELARQICGWNLSRVLKSNQSANKTPLTRVVLVQPDTADHSDMTGLDLE